MIMPLHVPRIRALFPVSLALLLSACGGANGELPPPPAPPPPIPSTTSTTPPVSSSSPASSVAEPPPPPAPAVELVAGQPSPDPVAPLPTVKFLSPKKQQVIPLEKASDFEIKLAVDHWKTAMGDAHVHLILDDKPYKPLFDTKVPVKLSELAGNDAIAAGHHVLVAFPSRANHESVKTAGALSIVEFWIDRKNGERLQDVTKPTLIFSRPKGEYKGDMANHVLIDFQLANAVLAPDKEHVHISVSGPGIEGDKAADVTRFGTPYYLENLQTGAYTIKLELLGADAKPLAGAWNSVVRTFNVTR